MHPRVMARRAVRKSLLTSMTAHGECQTSAQERLILAFDLLILARYTTRLAQADPELLQ